MSEQNKTAIERHMIGGQGPLLQFLDSSRGYASWSWSDEDCRKALRTAARIEDKAVREFALSLIDKIDTMREQIDELRKRFDTTFNAVSKINESLKSQ